MLHIHSFSYLNDGLLLYTKNLNYKYISPFQLIGPFALWIDFACGLDLQYLLDYPWLETFSLKVHFPTPLWLNLLPTYHWGLKVIKVRHYNITAILQFFPWPAWIDDYDFITIIDIDGNPSELRLNVEEMETSPIRDKIVENSDEYHSSIMQVILFGLL